MYSTKTSIISALMVIAISIVAAGCGAGDASCSPVINKVIDTKSAYDMIQVNEDNPNFVIIDVRTREEFSFGHIPGAIMVDIYLPDFTTNISELDRSKKYLVYCRTARRSGNAVKTMKDLGFREVYDMAGGINQWKSEGFPIAIN